MSKLAERYPHAKRLPQTDVPLDDTTLLDLLQPYLKWVLAEIDTASLDILICESASPINTRPLHVLLLTGRAVNLWLRHAGAWSGDDSSTNGDAPPESH